MPSYAITGASRGLGLELTRQLSASSGNVVLAIVRNPDKATKLKELASSRQSRIHILTADVTDPKSLLAAAASADKVTGGQLDVLIHNAFDLDFNSVGLTPSQLPFDRKELEGIIEKSMGTDFFGTIWTTNAFLPLIEKGSQKKVIHITTGMADLDFIKVTGISNAVPSGLGKTAMNMLSTKYAAEFANKGIKFLALSPGWVDTAEGPIPPEAAQFFEVMLKQFQRADPGVKGPISVEDSVRMQLEVIDKLDGKLSGEFLSHHGNKNWF